MTSILFLQLPIPQLNFGRRTGNVPLAAACLKQAAVGFTNTQVDILPESISSYLSDSALLQLFLEKKPDIIGFSLFNWNIERSIYLAEKIKSIYDPKIIFGGPEVTPDNFLKGLETADFLVYGEGEAVFQNLLEKKGFWLHKTGERNSEAIFRSAPSPYVKGLLEPEINKMMYLESQRGCPYRCGFCYYNKSMNKMTFVEESKLLEGVQWAVDQGIDELCFLDPSLNTRPGLQSILAEIRKINKTKRMAISGEIRAEKINEKQADLFLAAGFSMFEIGLQSTNPKALKKMNRPTDISRFLQGIAFLKERDILPRIDLIVGLPGDTLEGFKQSADFVAEHDLHDDIMVFPLSVLPGTDFRKKSKELNLTFEQTPPYTILQTPQFSQEEMLYAFDYAEDLFDISLFPDPHIDVSYRTGSMEFSVSTSDNIVWVDKRAYISKLMITPERDMARIEILSSKLTHPYQVFVTKEVSDKTYVKKILAILSSENPHTPFEVIFMEPEFLPNTKEFLSVIKLKRPHYLDNDLRFLYGSSGNRTVLFTLVSQRSDLFFYGEMKRQVFWWKNTRMPEKKEIHALSDFSGLLIDTSIGDDEIESWQDCFAKYSKDILFVSFAEVRHQKRWMELTSQDEYYLL